uniref:Ubiquitinyl hydrolase 1 n=1 Tax=Panagrolaimus sp. ES5 TaxID=591445 RepID=A0AC34F558_9BILA
MGEKEPEFIFYHEQQELQMCLKHALNNLLQRPAYTKELLNEYCLHLDDRNWFNPHRSMLGLGNYDFTVLPITDGRHYNLDSKLTRPERIADFPAFFNDHLAKGGEILIATKFEHDEVINKPSEEI